jgi:hypothetical protein
MNDEVLESLLMEYDFEDRQAILEHVEENYILRAEARVIVNNAMNEVTDIAKEALQIE